MPLTPVTLNFLDPSGAPLANGSVRIRLTQDASNHTSGGPQIAAGRFIEAQLDSSGTVTLSLWPTSGLLPSVTYEAQAFTVAGLPCWRGSFTV
jgi:hypothetical protein